LIQIVESLDDRLLQNSINKRKNFTCKNHKGEVEVKEIFFFKKVPTILNNPVKRIPGLTSDGFISAEFA
jgi:hypothetical protein